MKQLFFFFLFIVSLASCYGPRKVNSWIADKYGMTLNTQPKIKDDYFSVSSKLVANDQQPSTTVKESKGLLPLIFYWRGHYVNTVTLNLKIPINTFITAFQSYANSKQLKQKLNGQKIELTVEQVPTIFMIDDKWQLIWLIYAFGWDIFSVLPEKNDLTVSYRIFKDNSETKKATITIADQNKSLEHLRKVKEGTWDYLNQYDEAIKSMAKKTVDKIIEEL